MYSVCDYGMLSYVVLTVCIKLVGFSWGSLMGSKSGTELRGLVHDQFWLPPEWVCWAIIHSLLLRVRSPVLRCGVLESQSF